MPQMCIDHMKRGEVPSILTSVYSTKIQCRSGLGLEVQNIAAWHKIMTEYHTMNVYLGAHTHTHILNLSTECNKSHTGVIMIWYFLNHKPQK
jgi:hypothetical protein